MALKRQHAVLPYVVVDGEVRVLMLTSRETKRWVIPKGWPKKKMTPYDLGALEAYEEAGLKGQVYNQPIGSYHYVKILKDGSETLCRVDVYPMLVKSQLLKWPEKGQRKLTWMSPARASRLVQEQELGWILKSFRPAELEGLPNGLADRIAQWFRRFLNQLTTVQ